MPNVAAKRLLGSAIILVLGLALFGWLVMDYRQPLRATVWALAGALTGLVIGWLGRYGSGSWRRPQIGIPLIVVGLISVRFRYSSDEMWTSAALLFWTVFFAVVVFHGPIDKEAPGHMSKEARY